MTTTKQFVKFPFTYKGLNFVSEIAEDCRFLPQILNLGEEFITMNKEAIDQLINLEEQTSLLAVEQAIKIINDGGTEMFLRLGDN